LSGVAAVQKRRQELEQTRKMRQARLHERVKQLKARKEDFDQKRQEWESEAAQANTFEAQIADYKWKWERLMDGGRLFPLEAKHIPLPVLRAPNDNEVTRETLRCHMLRFVTFWESNSANQEPASIMIMRIWRYDNVYQKLLPKLADNCRRDVADAAQLIFSHAVDIIQEQFMGEGVEKARAAKWTRKEELMHQATKAKEEERVQAERRARTMAELERKEKEERDAIQMQNWKLATTMERTGCRQRDK